MYFIDCIIGSASDVSPLHPANEEEIKAMQFACDRKDQPTRTDAKSLQRGLTRQAEEVGFEEALRFKRHRSQPIRIRAKSTRRK